MMSRLRIWQRWRTSTSRSSIANLRLLIVLILHGFVITGCHANLPPYFTDDMNNHVIPENTPVGTAVYTLKAVDPEKSELRFGIMGTDKLRVDDKTGVVTIAKPIDREVADRLKVSVTVEDVVSNGNNENNVVTIPVSITISDSNDNAAKFVNQSIFENLEVIEDTRVGSRIVSIEIQDPDLTGMSLSINCTPSTQSPEACEIFPIDVKEATAGFLKAEMRLGKKLDYNKRSLYQFVLTASDGEHVSKAGVLIRIKDVQNTPPVFTGAMAGRVMEDAPVGYLVMIVQARDGDLGKPRDVRLTLLSNPGEVFQLDSKSGHLTTTRPLDRESLGSLLTLQVRAQELFSDDELSISTQADIDVLQTVANITVLIDDVNDSEPKFNKKEYFTEINENTPIGTPLSDLDMVISDSDTGTFADFTLRIDGPLAEVFDIQPKFGTGSVRPVIRVKKAFDHENPNERKFILLIIAQNTDEPELFSSATVSVSTMDENDNRPKFDREVYMINIPESTKAGTKIGQITADDPDSKEFGDLGLIYQVVGSGSKRFTVNNKTGEIFVAECAGSKNNTFCLDFETQKTYDLLYMASDNYKQEGFIHAIVPLQILLTDSNDNPVYFNQQFSRVVFENSRQFEPRFFVKAKDIDDSSVISYKILNETSIPYFRIDENTAEILIKKDHLPPGNYSFEIEANDGLFKAVTPIKIQVIDINNHYPVFSKTTLENRIIVVPEDTDVGIIIATVDASDEDLKDNGLVRYSIDKGAYGFFEINEVSGEIMLMKELDNEEIAMFDLLVTAYDAGTPPMRTSTTIQINVGDVYKPLPKIWPVVQRVQVSESAEIGDIAAVVSTNIQELNLNLEDLQLKFSFIEPIEARNSDNKPVKNFTMAQEWFKIDNEGKVLVIAQLQRELVTAINFTIMVTSDKSRPGLRNFGSLMVTIFEVNDLPPKVDDMEIETYEELPPGMGILTLEAEDPEGGQISNYFIQDGADHFSIDNKTGEIKVAGRLDYEDKPMYNITVVAVDSGVPQLSSTATIMISLVNVNDNNPSFEFSEYNTEIHEHPSEGTLVKQVIATDPDVDDIISYEIVPSDYSRAFDISRLGEVFVTRDGPSLIDRDLMESPYITLSIKASDSERSGYTTIRIHVLDINDIQPKFEQKNYHITAHAPLRAQQEIIRVSAHGGDLEETDRMKYKIFSGNDEGIFEVDSETGVIRASQAFEKSGEFRLVIEVTDLEQQITDDHIDRADLLIQILPGNFKKPEFLFPNKINSTLIALESSVEETEKFATSEHTRILGQVLAFDPDEGDAGKIQFFFKDGDNLVTETDRFRIETDSGKIHQIRPLDREEMNKYDLVVVAKDNGIPVSTQSQHILTILIMDIDDHKPFFKIRNYDFAIKENSLENSFIGQVQAVDEDDAKNAQIFYFLVSEAKDQYLKEDIRVDIKTGMMHTNAVLDRERIENYRLYVRASSSPLINKSMEIMSPDELKDDYSLASVNITVLDENDNAPRFPEKQYYAAINSDAEPGREILTLESVDIDLSSPVQYSLIGANLILDDFKSGGSVVPSPFRVDSVSGRLTLSASAMRQYAGGNNRFQVKVGVREVIPPYHSDTTQVQVWVVESSQETVLAVKSPTKTLLKDSLVDVLSNITGNSVLITKIAPHVTEELSVNKDWSDVYVTAIDKKTFQTVPVSQFLQALDLGHDQLRNADTPIVLHSAVPAISSVEGDGEYYYNGKETFDTAFAGLIALIALLCMGLAAIIACCCCLNKMYEKDSSDSEKQTIYAQNMKYPLHASHPSIPGTPNIVRHNPSDMIEDMATDNPLWIDHKMKTYEEQELTMQVASELDNSNGSIDDGLDFEEELSIQKNLALRQQSPQFSHAYATLHPHPQDYDNIHILGEDTIAVHL